MNNISYLNSKHSPTIFCEGKIEHQKITKFKCIRMEYHQQQLTKHCRICGKRLSKLKQKSPAYKCTKSVSDLLSTFETDISKDLPTVHPVQYCNPCHLVIKRAEDARQHGLPYTHTTSVFNWTPHSDDHCLVSSDTQTHHHILLHYIGLSTL